MSEHAFLRETVSLLQHHVLVEETRQNQRFRADDLSRSHISDRSHWGSAEILLKHFPDTTSLGRIERGFVWGGSPDCQSSCPSGPVRDTSVVLRVRAPGVPADEPLQRRNLGTVRRLVGLRHGEGLGPLRSAPPSTPWTLGGGQKVGERGRN